MKKNTVFLCLFLLTTVCIATRSFGDNGALRPNIIYILADDLGYGEVGYHGQKKIKTPELDKLAAGGMIFTSHYCGNAVCAPSRCSLMTGRHPGKAFIRSNSPSFPLGQTPIPADSETLAKLTKRAGYNTAIIGKWGLGARFPDGTRSPGHPLNQGFDHFFGYLDQRRSHNYYPDYLWNNDDKVQLDNKGGQKNDYSHDLMTADALRWVQQQSADTPFFLYLAYCVPHVKYQVPDQGQYKDKRWKAHFRIHAAMTSRMDRDIGRLVDQLEKDGQLENTLIIFNSDNGAHGQQGSAAFFKTSGQLRGIKRDLYEGGVRSPMLAYWKGTIKPGSTSDHLSAFWDMLPTFSELTGQPVEGEHDGISMVPTLIGKGEQQKHPYLYWELYEKKPNRGVRMGKWKGVISNLRKSAAIELYDVTADIGEQKNLAAEYPEVVERIKRAMEESHVPSKLWTVSESGPTYQVKEALKYFGLPESLRRR